MNIDHVKDEDQSLPTGNLIELPNFSFLPFRVKPANLLKGVDPLISINNKLPANVALYILDLSFLQKGDKNRGLLDLALPLYLGRIVKIDEHVIVAMVGEIAKAFLIDIMEDITQNRLNISLVL